MLVLDMRPLIVAAAIFAASPVATGDHSIVRARTGANAAALTPPPRIAAGRVRPRPGAIPRGTDVSPVDLFGARAFAGSRVGFALANVESAQYPARSVDGGRSWRIDGPQLHIDAADGAEGVGSVGVAGPRTFFAYGSSVVVVTTDGGRTWWEALLGELVVAVVPGPGTELVAYVQQQSHDDSVSRAVTWQYISRDGGREWIYSPALGG